jgi:hypothetical protein
LDDRGLVDLEPELEMIELGYDCVRSWFRQDVLRDAVWRFQGATHCTHAVQLLCNCMVDHDPTRALVNQEPGESGAHFLSPC